jgi:hypothetical protein
MSEHNGSESGTDWQAQANFWQLKYFELLVHSQQVIAALNQPMLQQVRANMLAAHAATQVKTEAAD